MNQLSRRNLLGAASAFASGALVAAPAALAATAPVAGDKALLALIAEEARLRALCSVADEKTMALRKQLPNEILRGPRVIFRSRHDDAVPKPTDRIEPAPYHFRYEEQLTDWLARMRQNWSTQFTEARQAACSVPRTTERSRRRAEPLRRF